MRIADPLMLRAVALAAAGALPCSALGGAGSGGVSGGLPCYYEPTIVFGPPCPGNPNAFHSMFPRAINSAGQVAGDYGFCLGGSDTAFVWTAEQGLLAIPEPPDVFSSTAQGIANDTLVTMGPVTGRFDWSGGPISIYGFVYDGLATTLIDPLPGQVQCWAEAINDDHVVVGFSTHPATGPHKAFRWERGAAMELDLPKGPGSAAVDINDLGEITGWMGDGGPFGGSHGFVWQDGEVTEISVPDGAWLLDPRAISNQQQIVGRITYLDSPYQPFAWSEGKVTQLPLLPDYDRGLAWDVNDHGLIVGSCTEIGDDFVITRAVVWHDGVAYDLNDMVPDPDDVISLGVAISINNDGVIVAQCDCGPEHDDHTALVILAPVYPAIGDLNCDGLVGPSDLAALLAQWGPGDSLPADFNADGIVGPFDLAQLLGNWGPSSKGGS